MSVDPATGARTLVSGPGRGTGPAFVSPISVTSDSPDSVVVLDTDFSAGTGLGRGIPQDHGGQCINIDIICALNDISEVPVSRTVIDLDDELVAEVARALGTRTKKDTVNTALREVLENRRRAVALTRLREAAAEGAFDLELLDDKRNYRR